MFKNKKTRNIFMLIALVLVTSLFVGTTIARYVTSTSSEDEARVAVWGINKDKVTMDLFNSTYELEDGTVVAQSNDGDNIIAPGTSKSSNFSIVNLDDTLSPEVMYELRINLDDSEIDPLILNNPSIEWKLDNNDWGTWEKTRRDILTLSGDTSGVKVYSPLEIAENFKSGVTHTISWQWKMDNGIDEIDTAIGNKAVEGDISAKIVISVTATQVNTGSSGILEGDGQIVDTNNIQPKVFRSAADFDEFQSVVVNGETLTRDEDYTAESGSTIITLLPSYLETLDLGNYTIEIVSTNSTASASFNVSDTINDFIQSQTLVTGKNFNSRIPDTATKITFDTYSTTNYPNFTWGSGEYLDINNTGTIQLFNNGTEYYVLSKDVIYTNPINSSMFQDKISLVNVYFYNINTSKTTTFEKLFYGCNHLVELDLSNFDTSNVTSMNGMFQNCMKIRELDLSNFNTENVQTMSNMFNSTSLTTLNLSNFDTSNVIYMIAMFATNPHLSSLDLSNFNTTNVTSMKAMFYHCPNLKYLDLSNFNTANVTDMGRMFHLCKELRNIFIAPNLWNTTKVTVSDNMFADCIKLPNYKVSKVDKTYAHANSGGYLTNIALKK